MNESTARTSIDFVGQRRRWFIISGIAIVISLLSIGLRHGPGELGLNLSLDFRGGTSILLDNPNGVTVPEFEDLLGASGITDSRVEELDDGAAVRIRTEFVGGDTEIELVDTLAVAAGTDSASASVESVGPTFGALIARAAVIALVTFLAAVSVFIAIRFEWKMAGVAIAALFHDLIITAGVYSLLGFEVTPSTVVAVLTILGYSLYDTVVIFDKIEETVEKAEGRKTFDDIVNESMNLVLSRSIATSLTSLLPVGSLLFLGSFFLGAGVLTDFALALFVGIAAGTYSSIFIAAPLLDVWKDTEPEWIAIAERQARREGLAAPQPKPVESIATPTEPGTEAPLAGGSFDSNRPTATGAKPRPPKKRRK